MSIDFPNINPIAFSISFLDIRWYSLAYIFGIIFSMWNMKRLNKLYNRSILFKPLQQIDIEDMLIWAVVGIIVGARIGNVVIYDLDIMIKEPIRIFKTWEGGLSFHGGLLGLILSLFIFCKRRDLNIRQILDMLACSAPFGIMLGRMANFINGEVYGRITDVSWSVIFPYGGNYPRHPSQLYEAFLEGFILLIIMHLFSKKECIRNKLGSLSGIFAIGYSIARIISEFFREPDGIIYLNTLNITIGQLLTLPILIIGLALLYYSKNQCNNIKTIS